MRSNEKEAFGTPFYDVLEIFLMIVALAGRRIDAPNQEEPRFPLANIGDVQTRIRQQLKAHQATTLICSGACGADLLALEVAVELGLRFRLVLPFAPERFREVSVIDRPGDWGPLFDRTIEKAIANNDLVVLQEKDDEAAFMAVNRVILEQAIALNTELDQDKTPPLAMIVWNGRSRGEGDVTGELMTTARDRGFAVVEVLTC
jgi:hypothetical protein